jgi:beta-glucosidase-like glycosyl hydrolase/serine/threonine protein kinase
MAMFSCANQRCTEEHATMRRMALASGATFAGFTIVRLLGSGYAGTVYLAADPRNGRRVALKIMRAEVSADPHFRDRFGRETDLVLSLNHPNIVAVVDHGESGRRLWVATEFVDGPDAGQLVRERYPSGMPQRAVSIIVNGVAEALDFAHDRGLVHEHVKPTNILLGDPYSDGYRILLAGFGTAPRVDNVADITAPTGLVDYAASEQLTGRSVDGRTDQYGLAATAFHLLTAAPHVAHSVPLADSHPDLAELDQVFGKALASDPGERYDTCRDFAAALDKRRAAVLTTASSPPPPSSRVSADLATSPRTRVDKPPRRSDWPSTDDVLPEPPALSVPPKPTSVRSTVLLAVLGVIVAGALVVGLMFLGRAFRVPASSQQASQAAGQPSSAMVSAPPLSPPVCGDPAALSLRDKLAQLLMVGVTGADDARAVVANDHVGGIFIGSWTDLSMLSDGSLRDIADSAGPLNLAVSVDEEGGRVQRLSSLIGSQPSPRELVASGRSPQEVHDIAFQRGQKMKDMGITIDFAPVVDVTDAPDDTVIGDRSFGSNPQTVIDYAGAYAQGLRDAGLLPVLKHFPGHGRGSGDSHTGGVTTPPLDQLKSDDLLPYGALTTQGPVAVMVGHLQVPGLTGSEPASLSAAAYNLLRSGDYGGPGFGGLVFTDDLSSMAAINQRYGVAEAALRALQAGADIALWVTTDEVPAVLDRLEQAVNSQELSMGRVDVALQRVTAARGLKEDCGR